MNLIRFTVLAIFFLNIVDLKAQDFEWASLIDVPEANQVKGMDTDAFSNVYLCGAKGFAEFIGYEYGSVFFTKTDPAGEQLWSRTIGNSFWVSDLICTQDHVFITGQSQGDIIIDGNLEFEYPSSDFLAVLMFNFEGDLISVIDYTMFTAQFLGRLTHDEEIVAFHCRGAGVEGFSNHSIVLLDQANGAEIQVYGLPVHYLVADIEHYAGWTYVTGFQDVLIGEDVEIDNVSIPSEGPLFYTSFVLAFDQNFEAQWGYGSSTFGSEDSKISVVESGIYTYNTLWDENFENYREIWRFDFDGNLLASATPAVADLITALRCSMDVSECHLVLTAPESVDNDSQKIVLFDLDLNMITEKYVNGNSPYSAFNGRLAVNENQIYFSSIHIDNMNFNDEVEIVDDLDDTIQYPYVSKIAVSETCGAIGGGCEINNLSIESRACVGQDFWVDVYFEYNDVSNEFELSGNGTIYGTFDYGNEPYNIGPFEGDGTSVYEVQVTDLSDSNCSASIEFIALDCTVDNVYEHSDEHLIFPIPASNELIIRCKGKLVDYQLFDLAGRELLFGVGNTVDVSSISQGQYLIVIKDQIGNLSSHRIIIE